jgi:hypothetical protein
MGGEVEIESTRGEGTKVGLRLPTRPSAASSRREGEENLYSRKRGRKTLQPPNPIAIPFWLRGRMAMQEKTRAKIRTPPNPGADPVHLPRVFVTLWLVS